MFINGEGNPVGSFTCARQLLFVVQLCLKQDDIEMYYTVVMQIVATWNKFEYIMQIMCWYCK